jgi:hypothetical protein
MNAKIFNGRAMILELFYALGGLEQPADNKSKYCFEMWKLSRMTKLGEFLSMDVCLFSAFFKNFFISPIFGYFLKVSVMSTKNGLGHILGDFFAKSYLVTLKLSFVAMDLEGRLIPDPRQSLNGHLFPEAINNELTQKMRQMVFDAASILSKHIFFAEKCFVYTLTDHMGRKWALSFITRERKKVNK